MIIVGISGRRSVEFAEGFDAPQTWFDTKLSNGFRFTGGGYGGFSRYFGRPYSQVGEDVSVYIPI